MDLGTWLGICAGIVAAALTLHATIISWHDREAKRIKEELLGSLNRALKREKKVITRERQCRDALYAVYEWVHWAQRNLPAKFGSSPAPQLPRHPDISDIENEIDEQQDEEKQ